MLRARRTRPAVLAAAAAAPASRPGVIGPAGWSSARRRPLRQALIRLIIPGLSHRTAAALTGYDKGQVLRYSWMAELLGPGQMNWS
jgi:hypothetical protein